MGQNVAPTMSELAVGWPYFQPGFSFMIVSIILDSAGGSRISYQPLTNVFLGRWLFSIRNVSRIWSQNGKHIFGHLNGCIWAGFWIFLTISHSSLRLSGQKTWHFWSSILRQPQQRMLPDRREHFRLRNNIFGHLNLSIWVRVSILSSNSHPSLRLSGQKTWHSKFQIRTETLVFWNHTVLPG